jgi:toxin CcdB
LANVPNPPDVFPNPSRTAAEGIPYVVVIQSDLIDSLATRLTVPLASPGVVAKVPTALCPVIVVKGERLHALAHYAAPLPAKVLRGPVDNVVAQASALVSAMDMVLSGVSCDRTASSRCDRCGRPVVAGDGHRQPPRENTDATTRQLAWQASVYRSTLSSDDTTTHGPAGPGGVVSHAAQETPP